MIKKVTNTNTTGPVATLAALAKRIPQPIRTWAVRLGWVIGAYLAVVIITGLAIYVLGWRGALADAVSRVTYYPVVQVNGRSADYHEYYVASRAVAKSGVISGSQLARQAMSQLESGLVLSGWAGDHGIKVSANEVDQALNQQLAAMGGTKSGLAQVKQTYGYSRDDYRDSLARQLLQQKVTAALATDTTYQAQLRSRTTAILRQALTGSDFDKLASAYSQDITGVLSGDQALLATSALPVPVAQVAAKLSDGQVYAGVISTGGNHYIVKRVRSNGDSVMVRIIELKPSFNQWLAGQLSQANVFQFMPIR